MKKTNLIGGMLLLAATTPSFAVCSFVTIEMTDGVKKSYLLVDAPKISYTADSLIVSGTVNESFALSKVDFYNFTDSDVSAVPVVNNNEVRISYYDNSHIRAEGLQPGTLVTLFSTTGAVVSQLVASESGSADLVLPPTAGIYILKTNTQSVKLVKE